ncbi:MAG: transglutaminase domain-containing protein [Anaerolineales bacterium]|nr:MAG: transglutaminase domain-containing protein [Anaerolineales bacterium]
MQPFPSGGFFLYPTWVKYQVVETYTFLPKQAGDEVWLVAMRPKNNAYQRIENINIQWSGQVFDQQHDGIETIFFERVSVDAEAFEAQLIYNVALLQGHTVWQAPIEEKHTRAQKYIESDASQLTRAAKNICTEQNGDWPYRIFSFTASHLSLPQGTCIGGEPSALDAYDSQVGVCGAFANLMTALARACNTPAKSISGLSMPLFLPPWLATSSTWNHPGGAHAWVEIHTSEGWTIADPSWASGVPFARFWFGRSSGQYLSYGEVGGHDHVYEEILEWGKKRGGIIGAMSAPLKFVAISNNDSMAVIPSVTVKKYGMTAGFLRLALTSFS